MTMGLGALVEESPGVLASGSGSLTISASRRPSGDQARSLTPPGRLVTRSGSPPGAVEQPELVHLARVVAVGQERERSGRPGSSAARARPPGSG